MSLKVPQSVLSCTPSSYVDVYAEFIIVFCHPSLTLSLRANGAFIELVGDEEQFNVRSNERRTGTADDHIDASFLT